MTQISAFWDRSPAVGDTSIEPYDAAAEWASIFSQILSSDGDGYVIPGYLNNLDVTAQSPVAAGVTVASGAAFVKGWRYLSDASENLTISANASGNPRIDRVVLRIDWTAKTVRLAVLTGTPAATPGFPALTQTFGTTWEVSLAYVWVANGFATIADTEIFDERQFALTMKSIQLSNPDKNLIVNSELMAVSNSIAATVISPPWGWVADGVASFVVGTKPAQMSRGRYVSFMDGGTDALRQTFKVKPSTTYALRGLLYYAASGAQYAGVTVTTNSAAPLTKDKRVRQDAAWRDILLLYTTESDATTMTITFTAPTNPGRTRIGQWMCIEGYIPGPYREFSEIIEADVSSTGLNYARVITDDVFDLNPGNMGTGATVLDLTASYAGYVLPGTKAIKLRMRGNDSGSLGAASCFFAACSDANNYAAVLDIAGIPNDVQKQETGWCPVSPNHTVEYVVQASGGGTPFDIGAFVIGIQT